MTDWNRTLRKRAGLVNIDREENHKTERKPQNEVKKNCTARTIILQMMVLSN